jgi:heme exporter protein A
MLELSADDISFSYGEYTVFRNLSFSVKSGEMLAVTGTNGSGKTTLLSLCVGLCAPCAGSVSVSASSAANSFDFQNESFMVTPDLRWYQQLTLRENLEFFFGKREIPEKAFSLIERFGLSDVMDKTAGSVSSGMLQKMILSAAFSLNPKLLALDEPSSHLDDGGKRVLYEVLDESRAEIICLLATHDYNEAEMSNRRISLV